MREQAALREAEAFGERTDGERSDPLDAGKIDGLVQDARSRAVAFGKLGHAVKIARPFVLAKNGMIRSFPRKRESRAQHACSSMLPWIPACAGMSGIDVDSVYRDLLAVLLLHARLPGLGQELGPILRNALLCVRQFHTAGLHLAVQEILHRVLLLEIALVERDFRRSALRPEIVDRVGAAELERDDVIELASLILAAVVGRPLDLVPGVG